MNAAHIHRVVDEVTLGLPDAVLVALQDVDVVVWEKKWTYLEVNGERVHDAARGMYVGDFPSGSLGEDGGEESDEEVQPPRGTIFLVADRIADTDEARSTFLHEIGHALGLDEVEVAALGL